MRVLIDSNIWVRSVERASPLLRVARTSLRSLASQGHELWSVAVGAVVLSGQINSQRTPFGSASRSKHWHGSGDLTAARRFNGGDIDFAHGHHGGEGAFCFGAAGGQCFG